MRYTTDIEMAIIGINYLGRASQKLALTKYDVHKVNTQMIAAMALESIAHG
jgi:hypothetical protein